jgi:hypothetical protein
VWELRIKHHSIEVDLVTTDLTILERGVPILSFLGRGGFFDLLGRGLRGAFLGLEGFTHDIIMAVILKRKINYGGLFST